MKPRIRNNLDSFQDFIRRLAIILPSGCQTLDNLERRRKVPGQQLAVIVAGIPCVAFMLYVLFNLSRDIEKGKQRSNKVSRFYERAAEIGDIEVCSCTSRCLRKQSILKRFNLSGFTEHEFFSRRRPMSLHPPSPLR